MSQIRRQLSARTSPVCDPQAHRPNPVDVQGLPHQERVWPKKLVRRLRIGTLNVGTMTGRGRELVDLMKRRRVDVLCVQETRWSGNKAKELGEGCKLIYGGANREGRNGVGIILSREMKNLVTVVNRKNDRIMWMRLALEDFSVSVFSVYAPQTGCTEEEKEEFWSGMEEEMEKVEEGERCIVGGDLNGHIGGGNDAISRVHGGNSYGSGNEEGDKIVDFAMSFDMVITNTIFKKRSEHLITYKSGGRASQIDYLLYRRRNISEIKNTKVIPGDQVTAQHRMVVMDVSIPVTTKQRREIVTQKRVKWFKLKDQSLRAQFKERVICEVNNEIEEINAWWDRISLSILTAGREILGESNGKIWEEKEVWWFNEEVQQKTRLKKAARKTWEESGRSADKEAYKESCREAKKAVAIAKSEAYDQLYEELNTKEGQGKIFKLAKRRNKSTKDITHIKQMKDENGITLKKESDIIVRWKQYFEKLLNEENERFVRGDGEPNQGEVIGVTIYGTQGKGIFGGVTKKRIITHCND